MITVPSVVATHPSEFVTVKPTGYFPGASSGKINIGLVVVEESGLRPLLKFHR